VEAPVGQRHALRAEDGRRRESHGPGNLHDPRSLDQEQTEALAQAGLDYYNHNLDTSPEFYGSIITTRTYSERLQTLAYVRDSGMKICSGGILGMGESLDDRANLLIQLANLPEHPESVPINMLVKVAGTPLENADDVDPFDFIRMLAVARILMPQSHVRLSAGREAMNEQMQALAFFAGANSIFYGDKLLTTANPQADKDMQLFARLGIQPKPVKSTPMKCIRPPSSRRWWSRRAASSSITLR
jgi:biotin synthase